MIGHKNLRFRIPLDTPPVLREPFFAAAKEEKVDQIFLVAPGEILDDHVPLNLAGIPRPT